MYNNYGMTKLVILQLPEWLVKIILKKRRQECSSVVILGKCGEWDTAKRPHDQMDTCDQVVGQHKDLIFRDWTRRAGNSLFLITIIT